MRAATAIWAFTSGLRGSARLGPSSRRCGQAEPPRLTRPARRTEPEEEKD